MFVRFFVKNKRPRTLDLFDQCKTGRTTCMMIYCNQFVIVNHALKIKSNYRLIIMAFSFIRKSLAGNPNFNFIVVLMKTNM